MLDIVKGFGEIQQYGVNHLFVIQSSSQVINGEDELGLTCLRFQKAMLVVGQDVVSLKVGYDAWVDNVIQDLHTIDDLHTISRKEVIPQDFKDASIIHLYKLKGNPSL